MENNSILVIITGGSKGFGRSLAIEFSKKFKNQLNLFLISRNKNELEKTREICKEYLVSNIFIYSLDLSDLENLEFHLKKIFSNEFIENKNNYKKIFLLNNSGSLGPLDSIKNIHSINLIKKEIDFNLTSTIVLCSYFLKFFDTNSNKNYLYIINISSLCGIKPFHSMGIYCIGKAAREMLHSVIAEEYKDNSHIITLNYSPGPMDTDMQKILREECSYLPIKKSFQEMKEKGTLVNPYHSAEKLINLLISGKFTSGDHIDYFDI